VVILVQSVVHIIDDDALIRASTSFLLSSHGYATEIYANGQEFLAEAKLKQGCILLDLKMPGLSGHQVQEELIRRGVPLPVIVVSGLGDLDAAVDAMKLGAVDFLQKPVRDPDLLAAVEKAMATFSKSEDKRKAKSAALAALDRLSARERQILQGLLAGLSNKEIARSLGLSPRTVEMHRASMMDDLKVSSLSEAVRIAIDAELSPLEESV
jgi:two-component system response regulator FixJ